MHASRARRIALAGLALAVLVALPVAARAGGLKDAGGHLSFGYSKLFIEDAPGGSMSAAAGIDFPVRGQWRAGVDIGFHLLGSRTVEQGSLSSGVDYSMLEAVALAHWIVDRGALGRISLGGGVMSARADLAAAAGGAAFSGYAVEEVAPGAALDVTVMKPSTSPVRAGLMASTRIAFLPEETWTVASLKLAVFY
jgi:hypothetical protein